MNRLDKTLLITVLLLGGILWLQHRWTIRLTEERDRFRMNSTALLSDVKRMRTDSATMAESQTKYQCDSNQRHEACVTFDKLSL